MTGFYIRLRPELHVSPARSIDGIYYVVEDRNQQRFWKIGELEYEVCSFIEGNRTPHQIVAHVCLRSKMGALAGKEKVHKVLLWLYKCGIAEAPEGNPFQTPGEPPVPAPAKPMRLFDPSSFRIPALSGDTIEQLSRPLAWLISIPSLVVAIVVWCVAGVMAWQNSQQLVLLGNQLFVPGSQWWLLVSWFVLKLVHETGHAIACVRVGVKPKGGGIGFMFFAPSPYVDVTGLWSVTNKWSRVLVSAAGMLFEITLAAIAVIGACSIEHPSMRYLCFSIATLGTFTTIAFNGNPLMRFDGYYILSDWIGRPNLWQDAAQSMRAYFASWIFKRTSDHSWSIPLLCYAIASWISRCLMIATLGWGIWMTWDGIGLVVVAFFTSLWFVVPQVRKWLAASRAGPVFSWLTVFNTICPWKAVRCTGLLVLMVVCSLLPSPLQIYWPAVVAYVDPSDIRTIAPGFVLEVLVQDGQGVQTGDEIVRLSNPDLEMEYKASLSLLQASEEKCSMLLSQRKHSELQAEEATKESLLVQANSLRTKVESLRLRAPRDGVLLSRVARNLPGSFVAEGQSIGLVIDPTAIEIHASVPQFAWDTVAHSVNALVSVHMHNGDRWKGRIVKTLPRTSDVLESPTLGGLYGGPISVTRSSNPSGEDELKTTSPRLQTRVQLIGEPRNNIASGSDKVPPPPGAMCCIKISSENEAIWRTGYRWLAAALQVQFPTSTGTQHN